MVLLDQNEDPVPPEAAAQEYEVEDVVKVQRNKEGEMEYLLKWQNFSAKSNTWQNEWDLNEVLKDYTSSRKTYHPPAEDGHRKSNPESSPTTCYTWRT